LPEVSNLFEVVVAVHPMKFSPLAARQGSENGMIEQSVLLAKPGFTLRNRFIHGGDARPDFASDLLRRHPTGQSVFRRLSALGHVSQSNDHDGPHSIPERKRVHLRLTRLQATLERFRGPSVSEIEVLKNFGSAPFAFPMTQEVFATHALRRRLDTFL
jgi:hypothetical protein